MATVTYYFYSFLANFITSPGAFFLFLVSFVLFMKKVVQAVVFPGSFRLWRRNIESPFCREMSSQVSNRISDLKMAIEILLEGSLEPDRTDFLPRSIAATTHSKRLLEILLETFEELRSEGSLKGRQLKLCMLIEELKQALQSTKLVLANHAAISLWEWFDAKLDEADYANVLFEDYPHNEQGLLAHSKCVQLEAFLFESYGAATTYHRVKRWLFDNTLGNIDQMRVELKNRFKTDTFWVEVEGGTVDCCWFWTEDPKETSPTVLICNPNAGFYEFAFYQSEWLEFYLHNGANVCMWNYRGYGRSRGRPTVRRLQEDAVKVVKHIKEVRGVARVAAHGESMGGCVVTYLAAHCKLEFVYADRTFWSLDKTAYFNFGRVAQVLLLLFTGRSCDSADNFLTATCPKFLSADPKDTMISDLSSLKAGVAERLTLSSAREFRVLPAVSLKNLTEAYGRLMKVVVRPTQTEFERSPRSAKLVNAGQGSPEISQNLSQYQLLSKDSDALDDEALTALVFMVSNSLYCLDAGGKPFVQLHYSKHLTTAMRSWLLVLEVWGSYLSIAPSEYGQTRTLAVERLKHCADDLEKLATEYKPAKNPLIQGVVSDITIISSCFTKVVFYLEDHLPKRGDASSSTVDSYSRTAIDYARAGCLVPLTCGHSGPYNIPEKMAFEDQLNRINFFSY
jgi:pimeloyl-ACP methyl ester carboxylesterase